jgi:hypothetical protein
MRSDVCLRCKYFQQREAFGECGNTRIRCELGPAGECRLDPPAAALTYDGRHDRSSPGVWPVVNASSWCGQYRQRSARQTVPPGPPGAQDPMSAPSAAQRRPER